MSPIEHPAWKEACLDWLAEVSQHCSPRSQNPIQIMYRRKKHFHHQILQVHQGEVLQIPWINRLRCTCFFQKTKYECSWLKNWRDKGQSPFASTLPSSCWSEAALQFWLSWQVCGTSKPEMWNQRGKVLLVYRFAIINAMEGPAL